MTRSARPESVANRVGLRIALIYAFVGWCWIVLSDRFLRLFIANADELTWLQTTKGILFVGVTASLIFYMIRDHTVRSERSKLRLADSEAFLRSMFTASPMGIYLYELGADGQLILLDSNPAADRMTGVDNRSHHGMSIERAFPKLIETELPDRYRELARNGGIYQTDDFLYEDEEIKGVYDVHAFQTSPGRMAVMFLEVTARRLAESRLKENERFLEGVFEAIQDGISVLDRNLNIVRVNRWMEKLYGCDGKLPGRRCFEAYQGRDSVCPWCPTIRVLETGESHHSIVPLTKPDGGEGWIELAAFPLRNDEGDTAGVIEYVRDITERRQAEEALRMSEATLASIFRAAPTGVGLVSDRMLLKVNARLCEMTGYGEEELVGRNARMLYPSQEEYIEAGREKYGQISLKGTGTVETRWYRKDGQIIDVLLSSTPLDPEDLSAGVTFTALDITELKQHRERLEELVRDRTAELEAAHEELLRKERLATLGQLAGSIAHELRNPLGAVRNAAYFLKLEMKEVTPLMQKHLSIIEEEVISSDRIIQELLEMSRGREPQRERLDLAQLMETARNRFRIPEGITCALELEEPGFDVMADRDQMVQVLGNLLVNAAQAMAGRGGIRIAARTSGDYDEILVCDSGPGVRDEDRERIFEPLFTTKVKGTGLGLPICREIVGRHGGMLDLVPSDGGAAFRIRLPRKGASVE